MFKKHDKVNALHLILKYSGALKTSEKQKQYAALTADTQRCIVTQPLEPKTTSPKQPLLSARITTSTLITG
jgi:hypothetical protein